MSDPRQLADHLRLFADLGVMGISRRSEWRERTAVPARDAHASPSAGAEAEASTSATKPTEVGEPTDAANAAVTTGSPTEVGNSDNGLDPVAALVALRTHIGDCTRCPLHTQGRRQVVFGVGNPSAELMFVGEAPGADEDLQGEPFVGRAGQLLTKIIEAIGLSRTDVYIANVIKCRPPGNRNPEPVEVATCRPFLFRQLDIVKPKVIVALGTFAAHTLLETDVPISRIRGKVHDYRGAKLIPTFHPAFLLRSPDRKRDVWEDMKLVRALLTEPS